MSIVRSFTDMNQVTEWTDEIVSLGNMASFVKGLNLFKTKNVAATSVTFDKIDSSVTLLPAVSRSAHETTYGKDRSVVPYALALPYFKHSNFITTEDVQGWRMAGTADTAEALSNVRAEKLEDLRRSMDLTQEYMMVNAVKGITVAPSGEVIMNAYTTFGVTQNVDTWNIITDSTLEIDAKIANVKRSMQKDLQTGGRMTGILALCSPQFFDAIVSNTNVREAYKYYQVNGKSPLRDDLSEYLSYGVSDEFTYKGVTFVSYDADFTLPDGTSVPAVADNVAHFIPMGVSDLFLGFYGPENRIGGANKAGQEMFAFEHADPKGQFIEMTVESSPLYICTRPKVLHKITAA